jgi:hypothetical protein
LYLLYDNICREDIVRHAYDLVRANTAAAGVDGAIFTASPTSAKFIRLKAHGGPATP